MINLVPDFGSNNFFLLTTFQSITRCCNALLQRQRTNFSILDLYLHLLFESSFLGSLTLRSTSLLHVWCFFFPCLALQLSLLWENRRLNIHSGLFSRGIAIGRRSGFLFDVSTYWQRSFPNQYCDTNVSIARSIRPRLQAMDLSTSRPDKPARSCQIWSTRKNNQVG